MLNSRPLVYDGDNLNNGITITPSHFLTLKTNTGATIFEEEDKGKDTDYELNNPSWKEVLLNAWKKGQRILESFQKAWKGDYLLSLKERSKLRLKSPSIEATSTPREGDIIQLKKDLPRGS